MKRINAVFPSLTYILIKTDEKEIWKVAKKSGLLAGGSEEYTIDSTRPAYNHFMDAITIVTSLNRSDNENMKEIT